jgi:hypothetical protein
MRRITSVVPLLDIGHPDIACLAHGNDPLRVVREQPGFFSPEEQTFRPIHLDRHFFLTEIKPDLRRKNQCRQFLIGAPVCLDIDMSVEEELKTENPKSWGGHGITFPNNDDHAVAELIGVRLCKRHSIQGDTTKDTSC